MSKKTTLIGLVFVMTLGLVAGFLADIPPLRFRRHSLPHVGQLQVYVCPQQT
jgi:hypothetical protein